MRPGDEPPQAGHLEALEERSNRAFEMDDMAGPTLPTEVPETGGRRYLNPPNLLSASRLPLAILFWASLDRPWLAMGIVLFAGLTDMLDGLVARWTHTSNKLGAVVDPIFDKLFVVLAVVGIVASGRLSALELVLLIARDILQVPLIVMLLLSTPRTRAALTVQSNYFGKATTVSQFLALTAALLAPQWRFPLVVVAAFMGVVCVTSYTSRAWKEWRHSQLEDSPAAGP